MDSKCCWLETEAMPCNLVLFLLTSYLELCHTLFCPYWLVILSYVMSCTGLTYWLF